jgi:hypothetical protein
MRVVNLGHMSAVCLRGIPRGNYFGEGVTYPSQEIAAMEKKREFGSSLFQVGSGRGNVVLLRSESAETLFAPLARQFHLAGKLLVQQTMSQPGYNDLAACPIVFCYRHALELYIGHSAHLPRFSRCKSLRHLRYQRQFARRKRKNASSQFL